MLYIKNEKPSVWERTKAYNARLSNSLQRGYKKNTMPRHINKNLIFEDVD